MSEYALIVESKEAKSRGGAVVTRQGDKFFVTVEREGWVEATSSPVTSFFNSKNGLPHDLKTFSTQAAAERFAERWGGHPWWCIPSGNFEVIEICRSYKKVPDGYKLKGQNDE